MDGIIGSLYDRALRALMGVAMGGSKGIEMNSRENLRFIDSLHKMKDEIRKLSRRCSPENDICFPLQVAIWSRTSLRGSARQQ